MPKLNLGCGPDWKTQYPDYDGLDVMDYGQKYIIDIRDKSLDIPHGSYDEVMANHFLEHLTQDELQYVFNLIHDVLVQGGTFKFVVPHLKKDKAWILNHKTFWNEETVRFLETTESAEVYGFAPWSVKELVTNEREDIHATLKKLEYASRN